MSDFQMTAFVKYEQPSFEELKSRFYWVNPFKKHLRLDPIESCKDISTENREVAFEYVLMDRDASTDEVLAEMDRRGVRPAMYEELLGFAEKYPNKHGECLIIALGSETDINGLSSVAYLQDEDDGHGLSLDLDGPSSLDNYRWHVSHRFLAVRK